MKNKIPGIRPKSINSNRTVDWNTVDNIIQASIGTVMSISSNNKIIDFDMISEFHG